LGEFAQESSPPPAPIRWQGRIFLSPLRGEDHGRFERPSFVAETSWLFFQRKNRQLKSVGTDEFVSVVPILFYHELYGRARALAAPSQQAYYAEILRI
jgi:hypothetical protein